MSLREIRTASAKAEIRKKDDEGLTFTGHAAVFDERTWIGPKKWGFWEQVDQGFFREVLEDDAAFLVNHDPNILLARNPSTMTLATDKRGLLTDADWNPEDRDAITWAARVRRGDANQMSFAFTVKEDKWEEDSETGEETRTLLTAERLYDVSLVTYPAYPGTDGGMRGDDQAAAEVVLRHRGIDPRASKPAPVVIDLGAPQTSSSGAHVELVHVSRGAAHEDLARRHRLIAARLGLPL